MDIVDDLRDLNSMHTPKEVSDIGEKAADEIERLRKIVIRLNMVVPDDDYAFLPEEMRKTIEALGEKK